MQKREKSINYLGWISTNMLILAKEDKRGPVFKVFNIELIIFSLFYKLFIRHIESIWFRWTRY